MAEQAQGWASVVLLALWFTRALLASGRLLFSQKLKEKQWVKNIGLIFDIYKWWILIIDFVLIDMIHPY